MNEGSTFDNGPGSGTQTGFANLPRDFNPLNRTYSGNFVFYRQVSIEFRPKINNYMDNGNKNAMNIFEN